MPKLSQKCQYALRTVFELARRLGQGPTSVSDIAERQAIPPRFLELIVKELRQAGVVRSRRGVRGGYTLSIEPGQLTIGQIICLFEGPVGPVDGTDCGGQRFCPLQGTCVFAETWRQARVAMSGVYDTTTFQDLLDRQAARDRSDVTDYSI